MRDDHKTALKKIKQQIVKVYGIPIKDIGLKIIHGLSPWLMYIDTDRGDRR